MEERHFVVTLTFCSFISNYLLLAPLFAVVFVCCLMFLGKAIVYVVLCSASVVLWHASPIYCTCLALLYYYLYLMEEICWLASPALAISHCTWKCPFVVLNFVWEALYVTDLCLLYCVIYRLATYPRRGFYSRIKIVILIIR